MVSLRWRKAAGDLKAHRGRTLLAVLAIAASLAAAGTVLDAWALVKVATREGFLASDPPAATIRVEPLDTVLRARVLAAVRATAGVRDAETRRVTNARIEVEGTTFAAQLFTADDLTAQRIGKLRGDAGEWPVREGAIVIEHSAVDFSGAQVGGAVRLQAGEGPRVSAEVTGIARDVTLAPGWMEHLVYAFVPRATLRAMGLPDGDDEVRLVVADGSLDRDGVRRIAYAAREAAVAAGATVRGVDVPEPGEHVHAGQMDSLLFTQGAFGAIALVFAAFLVVNLMAGILAGQVREIGVLKAVGARDAQLAQLYLGVAAAIGAAAVLLSLPVAIYAGTKYAALKADLLNFDLRGISMPAWVIALHVVGGVLLPVIASWPTVRRATRLAVADALRDVGIQDDAPAPALLHRVQGVKRPVLLSLRNAFRRRQRLVLTVVALSAAGGVFIGALGLRRAVLGATGALFASQRYDMSLRLTEAHDPDSLAAAARAVEGVEAAEAWTGASLNVAHEDGTFSDGVPVVAPAEPTTLLVPRVVAGRWLATSDVRALVVGKGALRVAPELVLGARLPMRIAGRVETWEVVGIAETGPGPVAYAPQATVRAFTGAGSATLVVRSALRGEASQLDLISRLRTALGEREMHVASSSRVVEAQRAVEDHLLMVVQFLGAMGWLMLVVGALGLASTMAIAVLERTRELGVLRAIGARDGTVLAMVQAEALTIGLLSWLLALPLAVPMSLALGAAFSRIMLPVPVSPVPDATAVLAWLVVSLVVSFAASAWPAWRATRVPAARALSYE